MNRQYPGANAPHEQSEEKCQGCVDRDSFAAGLDRACTELRDEVKGYQSGVLLLARQLGGLTHCMRGAITMINNGHTDLAKAILVEALKKLEGKA